MAYPPNDDYQQKLDKYYQYRKSVTARSLRYFHRQRLDAIFALISDSHGKQLDLLNILDAGCGRGANIIRYAKQGAHLIGVDISEGALRESNDWVEKESVQDKVSLVQGDILNLPFTDNSFDVIISSDVLSMSGHADLGINIMARLLKSGGTAIIAFPNPLSLFWIIIWIIQRLANLLGIKVPGDNVFSRFSYWNIKSVIKRTGLTSRKACSIYIIPFLHFEAYNKLEERLRYRFPFRYIGTHIVIEALKE